ncbi:hypothetical protein GZ77_18430 [Endozoicomonas montiporae]|uniref:Uncharacterized protein n=1 Tax=Endozoicomonas montiporae TaxID=1027273 RepID=A0A081N223_9GAMM|nr:hypothetical protein GZ77_18430 [Endozoicomonas montiporae]
MQTNAGYQNDSFSVSLPDFVLIKNVKPRRAAASLELAISGTKNVNVTLYKPFFIGFYIGFLDFVTIFM